MVTGEERRGRASAFVWGAMLCASSLLVALQITLEFVAGRAPIPDRDLVGVFGLVVGAALTQHARSVKERDAAAQKLNNAAEMHTKAARELEQALGDHRRATHEVEGQLERYDRLIGDGGDKESG